jgi:hypothetical protein
MKKETYSILSSEDLIKKRNLFKGVLIGFGVIWILIISVFVYLFATRGLKNISFIAFLPVFISSITLLPLLINLNLVNKEIKSRK